MRCFIERNLVAVPTLASAALALALQIAAPIVTVVHQAEHNADGRSLTECADRSNAEVCTGYEARFDLPSVEHAEDSGCALCSAAANAKPFVPQRSVAGNDFLEADRRIHDTTHGPRPLATLSLAAPRAPPIA